MGPVFINSASGRPTFPKRFQGCNVPDYLFQYFFDFLNSLSMIGELGPSNAAEENPHDESNYCRTPSG